MAILESDFTDLQEQVKNLKSLVNTRLLGQNTSSNYNNINEYLYDYQIISQTIKVYNAAWVDNFPGAGQVAWSACTVTYLGNSYGVAGGNTTAGHTFIYWLLSDPFVFHSSSAAPVLGDDDFLIAVSISGVHSIVWNKTDLIQTLSVLNTALTITGLTVTSNSPSAGYVAWSSFTLSYNGGVYTIASGNTNKKFAYWVVGDSTLTAADIYVPATNIYQVITNTSGTADTAWNKVARSGVLEDQLSFTIWKGQLPKGANVNESLGPVTPSGTYAATILDTGVLTKGGSLLSLGINFTTISGITNYPQIDFVITVDGNTPFVVPCVQVSGQFSPVWKMIAYYLLGTGASTGNSSCAPMGTGFNSRLIVQGVYTITTPVGTTFDISQFASYAVVL